MKFIAHRINTISELKEVQNIDGIELDVRPWQDKLIMQHDPFIKGEPLEELLKVYAHGTLIFNIKSERVELETLKLIEKYNIKDYFFLDSSLPMINMISHKGNNPNTAIRYSEIEPIENLIPHQGKVEWVWVDCFTKLILTKETEEQVHQMGFKICIVSPELQGRQDDILKHKKFIDENNIIIDAVCSKVYNRDLWMN
jgi:hypothetical protein